MNNPTPNYFSEFLDELGQAGRGIGSAVGSIFDNPFIHQQIPQRPGFYGAPNGFRPSSLLSGQQLASFASNAHSVTTPSITQTPTGYSSGYAGTQTGPSSFNIDTSGSVPSNYLGYNLSAGDVSQQQSDYEKAIQQLSSASQYSPDYLNDYQKVQTLEAQQNALKGNLATGNVPGDTEGYAEGFTNRALMGASAQEGIANAELQTQALSRTGNIAAAQALVEGEKPQSVSPGSSLVSPTNGQATYGGAGAYSDYQAQQTYFNLAQNFPDAQIPAYDPSVSAQQNLQNAQALASKSPSFQSRNLVQVQLPGGGISFVNRNQIVTGPDGSYTVISPSQATNAAAASKAISTIQGNMANISSALTGADSNFPLLLSIMQKAGINDFGAPLANQLQQAVNKKAIGSGDFASYNALVASLQATYAQVLSRGYQPTESTRSEATNLVNGNLSYSALKDLYGTLSTEGKNVLGGYQDTLSTYQRQLNSIYSSPSQIGSSGSSYSSGGSNGYIDPSQASW